MFLGFGAAGLGTKTIKNRRKKQANVEVHFHIDFWWILTQFWEGLGAHTCQKSIEKTVEKTTSKK